MAGFLGMGTMIEAFRHVGTVACVRERLKILVRIPASWSAHALITAPGIPSGPAAFLGFTALKFFLTSCSWRERGGVLEPGGGSDCRCVVVVSNQAKKLFSSSASVLLLLEDVGGGLPL